MKKIILVSLLFISYSTLWAQTPPTSNLGYLDTTFNSKGTIRGQKLVANLVGEARAIIVDDQERIVVAACSTNYVPYINVFRLNADGTLDTSFGSAITDTVKINMSSFGTNSFCSSLAIQKDGKILIGGNIDNNSMLIIRLNSNGSRDTTFDKDGIRVIDLVAGAPDQVSDIAVQSNGKIIISGTSAGKITVRRLKTDGSDDTGFNNYISTNTAEVAAGLEIVNDTIVVGGSYSIGTSSVTYYYSVIMLSPNGGGSGFIWRKDLPFSSSSSAYAGDIAVQANGKIIIGGNDYIGFRAYRLNLDGSVDLSFANSGTFQQSLTGSTLKNIVIEKNRKINLVGYYSSTYAILRTDTSGVLDNTFASGGKLFIQTGTFPSNAKSVLSSDQKLLIAGAYFTTAEIIKIELNPVIHIVGNGYVFPKSYEIYKIQAPPSIVGSYQWTYSGKYFSYSPNQTSSPLTLLFSDTATSGKLTYTIKDGSGNVVAIGEMNIIVNTKPSNATQLASLSCNTKLSNCSSGYIDYFHLNTLTNAGSGCSNNGYFDYTQSNFTDTLVAGGVYTAKLKIPNDGTVTNYVGIWIDYNNDGNFSNIDEFVGEGYTKTSSLDVSIFLKNREGYDGPKRIRVRSRPDVKIASTESCQLQGESGETEDYLIVLDKQPILEAPQIITPNEDGLNDYFVIRGEDPKVKNKLTIFDRIGAVKYSSSNYQNDWNGIGKDGNKLSPGTYYYVISTGKTSIKGFLEIRY